MTARRVAITGVGLVSPTGDGFEAFADAIVRGVSAATEIRAFDASPFPTRFAAQVAPEEMSRARGHRLARPFVDVDDLKSAWGVLAAERAIADSGWNSVKHAPERSAVILGTGLSSLVKTELEEDFLPWLDEDGDFDLARYGAEIARRARPPRSPARHLTDGANRAITQLAGTTGASLSHFGACAASTQAIGDAYRRVRDRRADAAICGGMDSMIHPFGMISFFRLGALSSRNDDMANACRPFQSARDGFLMGEGAAMLVLEPLDAARARGARIFAEIVGYGSSADGYNVTAPRPDGAGAAAAMRGALRDAGLAPEAIGYVNAHGTGTGLNDPAEARAVRDVFGAHAARLPISSVKPVLGHTIAAAGAFEVAACLAAIARDRIPPTSSLTSLDAVDAECRGLDHVLQGGRAGCPDLLMTNNYGFGGQNASLILQRL